MAKVVLELNKQISTTLEQSKGIAKLTDEVIEATLKSTRENLSDTHKEISKLERKLEDLAEFQLESKKMTNQTRSDLTKVDLTGNPAGQLDAKRKELAALAKDLQNVTSLDKLKSVYSEINTNIKQQGILEKEIASKNISNEEARADIIRKMNEETISYGEKIRNLDNRNQSAEEKQFGIKRKRNLAEIEHDKNALTEKFNRTMANYQKELKEKEKITLKEVNLQKVLTSAEIAKNKKTDELLGQDTMARVGKKIAETTLEDKIKKLTDLRQELDNFSFEKITKQTDPKVIQDWFAKRSKGILDVLNLLNESMDQLTNKQREKINNLVDQFKSEEEAINSLTKTLPGIKKREERTTVDLTKAQAILQKLEEERTKAESVRAKLEAWLIYGLRKTAEEISSRAGITGGDKSKILGIPTQQSTADALKALIPIITQKPDLFLKFDPAIQAKVLGEAGLSEDQLIFLLNFKDMSEKSGRALEAAATAAEKLASGFERVFVPLNARVITLDTSVKNINQIIGVNLKQALDDLNTYIRSIPTPTSVERPTVPEKVKKFQALGGMMGSDSVHAMLSPGEFVVNAASTRRFYSQLVAMNSVGRFAGGGVVGSTTNVGDINVSMQSSGNETVDVVRIGRLLQREIKRGTISLS